MHKLFIGLVTGLFLFSCTQSVKAPESTSNLSDSQKKEINNLHEKVMKIHDEVMPRISEIKKLNRNLKAKVVDLTEDTNPTKQEVTESIAFLEKADKGMFDWMAQYKMPSNPSSYAEAEKYLQAQVESISKVKEDMVNSISVANKLSLE